MVIESIQLWEKIKRFEIGIPSAEFSFSDRLARENGWSLKYAIRVISEYKKFIFLICTQNQPMTPSDQVDQAWHLHLLYTQDYWKDFCRDTLNKEIHHGPTKGGKIEKVKYEDLYLNTLQKYETTFNIKPPKDIWPPANKRFKKIHFVRVAKEDNFIISKNIFKWKN